MSSLKAISQNLKRLPIDLYTKDLLLKKIHKRINRNQNSQLQLLAELISSTVNGKTRNIRKILDLCYKDPRNNYDKDIQYFLMGNITSWPHESQMRILVPQNDKSLEEMARSPILSSKIKFPLREERHLPSLVEILNASEELNEIESNRKNETESTVKDNETKDVEHQLLKIEQELHDKVHARNLEKVSKLVSMKENEQTGKACEVQKHKEPLIMNDIEHLSLETKKHQLQMHEDQKYNEMLSKVIRLFAFLKSTSYLHSRSLTTPIAVIPITPLAEEIPECRKKNLIRKKIRYIRQIFMSIPPLKKSDSNYLTETLDKYYANTEPKMCAIRREYKLFLKKSYTIDKEFNFALNKYAHIQAKVLDDDLIFKFEDQPYSGSSDMIFTEKIKD
ncbi:hypothetical protein WICMUC_004019 [Wickerhamomyces mucosus]|uniref:Genetic interactor of prohibitin 5, mitochondrial n=1 Tax=Wickerhamomyces mucosus TaxID=1378264 RepID=A0A9P8PIN0_9ASCO|nr:hypothetical protein WICMUC_004019 [Wickerhamomyces mucosus]